VVTRADGASLDRLAQELEIATAERIPLASGGAVIIQTTAALVAIDVDRGSGGEVGAINRAAARLIARQIRLRRLGGMILIDFLRGDAAMRAEIAALLSEALSGDPAQLLGWSRAGLFEMTRPHSGPTLAATVRRPCPVCGGGGHQPALAAVAATLAQLVANPGGGTRLGTALLGVGRSDAAPDRADGGSGDAGGTGAGDRSRSGLAPWPLAACALVLLARIAGIVMPSVKPSCPICRRVVALPDFRPFCSPRCREVDLHRWLSESYRIPVAAETDEDGDATDPTTH
jgi:endogenous inhibitor of DNA gyrase (YacG/DUF329 family)